MNQTNNENAVSPVIAVILILMITIVMAGIVAVGVISLGGSISGTKTGYFTADYSGNPVLPIKVTKWGTSVDDANFVGVRVNVGGDADAKGSALVEPGSGTISIMLDKTLSYASYPVTVTGIFSDGTETVLLMTDIMLESNKVIDALQLNDLINLIPSDPESVAQYISLSMDHYSDSLVSIPAYLLSSDPFIVANGPDNVKCSMKITGITDGVSHSYGEYNGNQIGSYINLYLSKTGWNPSTVKAGDSVILEITYTSTDSKNPWTTAAPPLKILFT